MSKSKTFEILKQGGLWSALGYVADKKTHKGGIYALLQKTLMLLALYRFDKPRAYEIYKTLRGYNICIADFSFLSYFAKEYDNIKLWSTSQLFLEKYANHPYPPLLNPDTLDYEQISPQIAWYLNIPLPLYYKFCFFGSHATGNRGLNHFVLNCGGMDYIRYPSSSKIIYKKYWEQILSYHYILPPFLWLFVYPRIYER